ncbi:MAG: DUF447 family protein [Methylohalobius crimeensis]
MILETIVTTQDTDGSVHIAPMGVHQWDNGIIILPFRPSHTLDNLMTSQVAVVNAVDDVRIFAGCLTGRRNWPLVSAEKVAGRRLRDALAHTELTLVRREDDPIRPKLYCRPVHQVNHAPFAGFNRAQFAVLEAAILVSRLDRLPWEKIESELTYLKIGLEKTAGPREYEAWGWLMEKIEHFKQLQGVL